MLPGKPRKLGGEHVPLAGGRQDGHGEAVLKQPRQVPFKAAEMVHIGDDPIADVARNRGDQRNAAGRHVDHLAWEFTAIRI